MTLLPLPTSYERTSAGLGVLEDRLLLVGLLDLGAAQRVRHRGRTVYEHSSGVPVRQPSWVLEDVGGDGLGRGTDIIVDTCLFPRALPKPP